MRKNGFYSTRLYRLHQEQLKGLRVAERQAMELFPNLAAVASDEGVSSLLRAIGTESEIQLERLEKLMRMMDPAEESRLSPLSHEADLSLNSIANLDGADGDAAVLAAAQRALGFQIAIYESACEAARDVGAHTLLDILLLNLDEEAATSAALLDIAGRDAPLLRAI